MRDWQSVAVVFLAWMLQGGKEELIYRGWLFPLLGVKLSPTAALFVSSLLFSLAHGLNANFNVISFLNLFLFAILTALYAAYTGNIWGVSGLHAAWNWMQGNVFGLPVSGVVYRGFYPIQMHSVGPEWLNGGNFGPEGGIVVTLVLLLASVILGYLHFTRSVQRR